MKLFQFVLLYTCFNFCLFSESIEEVIYVMRGMIFLLLIPLIYRNVKTKIMVRLKLILDLQGYK